MTRTYEIISKTRDGKLVAVCTTEASSEEAARKNTARFCLMMGITVHSIRPQQG